VFICVRSLTSYDPIPPLYTLYTVYFITQGREGEGRRDEPERRFEGQQFKKLGRNTYTNMTD
jgi:hypothetical protein